MRVLCQECIDCLCVCLCNILKPAWVQCFIALTYLSSQFAWAVIPFSAELVVSDFDVGPVSALARQVLGMPSPNPGAIQKACFVTHRWTVTLARAA